MQAIRARIVAVIASFVLATLATWGVHGLTPEFQSTLEVWLNRSFDLVLFLGYALVHPWLQKRWNPTGAFTPDAARKLEAVTETKA